MPILMRAAMPILGLAFFISGFSTIVGVIFSGWPVEFYYLIVVLGLCLYTIKIYYINNTTLLELNYLTLAYYLLFYLIFIGIGLMTWSAIHHVICTYDPTYVKRLFGSDPMFDLFTRRVAIIGSIPCVSNFIGMHRSWKQLWFTNKVNLRETTFILASLSLLFISVHMISLFIVVVFFSTLPAKALATLFKLLSIFSTKKTAEMDVDIKNNDESDVHISSIIQYVVSVFIICLTALAIGLKVHLPLAIIALIANDISPFSTIL